MYPLSDSAVPEPLRTGLRGVGQVFFQENAWTGACFVLGISVQFAGDGDWRGRGHGDWHSDGLGCSSLTSRSFLPGFMDSTPHWLGSRRSFSSVPVW